jgi:hypothetical protein
MLIIIEEGKSHLLSPLARLSSYLMAIFDFNYKNISYLNTFSDIGKDKYLSDDFKV